MRHNAVYWVSGSWYLEGSWCLHLQNDGNHWPNDTASHPWKPESPKEPSSNYMESRHYQVHHRWLPQELLGHTASQQIAVVLNSYFQKLCCCYLSNYIHARNKMSYLSDFYTKFWVFEPNISNNFILSFHLFYCYANYAPKLLVCHYWVLLYTGILTHLSNAGMVCLKKNTTVA